jgi:hypothetical protein
MVGVHACDPNYLGSVNRRIEVQTNPGIKMRPCLEIIEAERAGGWGQVAEHLYRKCKCLVQTKVLTKET